ncbi:MAG: long-chain fatty acid--CoA ligase, partial [Crenarchaeota archaeon]|nr:long-chain fatty acid--CoA ligase [Thermoproteota archaeon]
LSFMGKELSYSNLETLSSRFGAALVGLGVKKGDCVALYLSNVPEFVIAFYGVLKIGAIVSAINPQHKEREVQHQLVDSGAKIIITQNSLFPILKGIQQKINFDCIIVKSNLATEKSDSEYILGKNGYVYFFEDLIQISNLVSNVPINPDEDLAALQYTGGTTGTAKAAMLTHTNLSANAFAFSSWIQGVYAKEVFLTALPLSHIYGLTTSLTVPILLAAKMVLLPKFIPEIVANSIQTHKVTIFCAVPTMYQTLLAQTKQDKRCFSSLRICISGASPLPVAFQKKFIDQTGILLVEGYGLTEASPVTHCNPVDKSLRKVKMGSIGLPLSGTESKIVDSKTGTKTLPANEIGELIVRGPQIMQGYWKNPQESALVLRDKWLYTGDLARKDSEGYFYIVDRKKDLIKHNGYSVYPRELEDVLYEYPKVKMCAVIGKPDAIAGEISKAYIVLKDDTTASEQEIKDFINKKVASYKAINEIEFINELPLGSAGKILKRALRERS